MSNEKDQVSPPKEDSSRSDKKTSRSMVKNIITVLLISLLINIVIGLFVDIGKTLQAIKEVSFVRLVTPFLCIMLVYVIDTFRYIIVFRRLNVHLSFKDGFYNNIIGTLFSNLTPSATGGQPFQIYHYTKLGLESTTSSNVVFSRIMESNLVQLAIILIFFREALI